MTERPLQVATVTLFYNSLEGLTKLIPSVYGYFKAHLFIDGVYKNWPMTPEARAGNGLSTDGSREYIWDCAEPNNEHNIFLYDFPYRTEYEKRSFYLDAELLIRKLDVDAILIMDSDEYINKEKTNWDLFYESLNHKVKITHRKAWNVFGIPVAEKNADPKMEEYQDYPSLWYKPWEMIYKPGSHYQFINYKWELTRHFNDNYSQYPIATVEGIKVYHDHTVREAGYSEQKDEYHRWLRQHEAELIEKKYYYH